MNPVFGILLVVLPLLFYQDDPETPLNHVWQDGQYRLICLFCGAMGGVLMAKRGNRTLGFRWAGGMIGGTITASLSYTMSSKLYRDTGESSVNIFIILVSALPGLIVYLLVKRCSDYTFPVQSAKNNNNNYKAHQSGTDDVATNGPVQDFSKGTRKETTPLLVATRL